MSTFKKSFVKMVVSLGLTVLSIGMVAGCSSEESQKEINNESNLITIQIFNQLEKGMTYQEVVEIAGFEGIALSGKDGESITEVYVWDGVAPKSFMSVTFKNEKLTSKMQNGLK